MKALAEASEEPPFRNNPQPGHLLNVLSRPHKGGLGGWQLTLALFRDTPCLSIDLVKLFAGYAWAC
jgi:hypothetical protein